MLLPQLCLKHIVPTNCKNCHIPGISATTCGSGKKFPIHENKLLQWKVPFHINRCKHFII